MGNRIPCTLRRFLIGLDKNQLNDGVKRWLGKDATTLSLDRVTEKLLTYESISKRISALPDKSFQNLVNTAILKYGGILPIQEIIQMENITLDKRSSFEKKLDEMLEEYWLGATGLIRFPDFMDLNPVEAAVIFLDMIMPYMEKVRVDITKDEQIQSAGDSFIEDIDIILLGKEIGGIGSSRKKKALMSIMLSQSANLLLNKEKLLDLKLEFCFAMKLLNKLRNGQIELGERAESWHKLTKEEKLNSVYSWMIGKDFGGVSKILPPEIKTLFLDTAFSLEPGRWYPPMAVSHLSFAQLLSNENLYLERSGGHWGVLGFFKMRDPMVYVKALSPWGSSILVSLGALDVAVRDNKVMGVRLTETGKNLLKPRILDVKEHPEEHAEKFKQLPAHANLSEILNILPMDTLREIGRKIGGFMAIPHPSREAWINSIAQALLHSNQFKRSYQRLDNNARNLVDLVHKKGGKVKVKEIEKEVRVDEEVMKRLHNLGLLFPLPSIHNPEELIMPNEYRFSSDLPSFDRGSLMDGLVYYNSEEIKLIARTLELNPSGPMYRIASNIYRYLLAEGEKLVDNLSPEERKILDEIVDEGGEIDFPSFVNRYCPQETKSWTHYSYYSLPSLISESRYDRNTFPARELCLKALLIPIGSTATWRGVEAVVIPKELWSIIGKRYTERQKGLWEELTSKVFRVPEDKITENAQSLFHDLRKLSLLLMTREVQVTQKKTLSKNEMNRLSKLLKLDPVYLEFLVALATYTRCIYIGPSKEVGIANPDTDLVYMIEPKGLKLRRDFIGSYNPFGAVDVIYQQFVKRLMEILHRLGKDFISGKDIFEYMKGAEDFKHIKKAIELFISSSTRNSREKIEAAVKEYMERLLNRTIQIGFCLGFIEITKDRDEVTGFTPPIFQWTGFRLSEIGRAAFFDEPYRPQKPPENLEGISILPNQEIVAPLYMPFNDLSLLAQFTDIKQLDMAAIFSINKASITRGLNNGLSLSEIREFLEKQSKNPLPQPLQYLFDELEGRLDEVVVHHAGAVIEVKDPLLLENIKRIPYVKEFWGEIVGQNLVILRPDIDLDALMKKLKDHGLIIKATSEKD